MGTPEFAVPSLKILLHNRYTIAAVITAPDKPRGRGQKLSPTPVKLVALQHDLPILQPLSLKDGAFAEKMKTLTPDIAVVVAFRILPKEIFTIPRLGSFNLHASLLPKYRGAAPINWAIINGEKETGVTTFFLEEKVDTGGVILQARVPISPDDDVGVLHDKLADVGAEVVLHTVRLIELGKAHSRPQDNSVASGAPKIFKEDCRIHWEQPALRLHDLIRGLSPYPTAFTTHTGMILKIYRSHIVDDPSITRPGEVIVAGGILLVGTADKALAITDLQQEGRKRLSTAEFLRGYKISTGERFE